MEIRRFREADSHRASEIIWKALEINNSKDYGADVLSSMKKEYSPDHICILSRRRIFLVLESENRILGIGGLENDFICSVFVDPDEQGKGIGNMIMKELESLAKKNNHKSVFLHSSLTAESFYLKNGYKPQKRIVVPVSGENILMEKEL
ncbi:GNAT family N-acetyltransferase [uncultured Algoriphagus sp.]|mgnify:CR=1 FL=1|uniref:GNAT family N-acetyltransferase n=1 Tax=Algoriphagus formosus TaxID=2007308 RepID=UPI002587D84D|nr:GNAT family N-acetyltransferase [uncultured Algoriphagus sp.]